MTKTGETVDALEYMVAEEDIDTYDAYLTSKKSKIRLSDMDTTSWKRDLKADFDKLDLLLVMLEDITPQHDSKLQMLISDLKKKFEHPINGTNKKVLVFTAFADTADYLYNELAEKIKGRSLNLPWRQPQLLTKDFTDTIEEEWNV